jgi:hypothetical protein
LRMSARVLRPAEGACAPPVRFARLLAEKVILPTSVVTASRTGRGRCGLAFW